VRPRNRFLFFCSAFSPCFLPPEQRRVIPSKTIKNLVPCYTVLNARIKRKFLQFFPPARTLFSPWPKMFLPLFSARRRTLFFFWGMGTTLFQPYGKFVPPLSPPPTTPRFPTVPLSRKVCGLDSEGYVNPLLSKFNCFFTSSFSFFVSP